jgi:hypothetical protein
LILPLYDRKARKRFTRHLASALFRSSTSTRTRGETLWMRC